MGEFSAIKTHIARHIQLSEEVESFIRSLMKVTRVRKKQCIVQPEFTCKYRSYIVQGAIRAHIEGVSNINKEQPRFFNGF